MSASSRRPETESERPLGELFSELAQNLQALLRKELELAKVEMQEQVSTAAKGAAMFAAMAIVGFVALLLLSFAAAWGLAAAIPTGLAFLAVAAVYLVAAAVLFAQGRKRLTGLNPVPTETMQSVQEDVQQVKSSLSGAMIDDPPWDYPGRRS